MGKISDTYRTFWIYPALALITFAVFWRVHNYEFVSFDDDEYVADNSHVNAGLTRGGIVWAFTKASAHNWHPLTWLSLMLDCYLFGTNAGWCHVTNLLLHIANTLLLFAVLKRMTGAFWRSGFVAAVFAIHPLHVESVAWIAERKDVLSTLFWMLTMFAYLRYVEYTRIGWYLVMLAVFTLGLMAKQMLVTLPFVLLFLDYWPLGRLALGRNIVFNYAKTSGAASIRRCILEKLPLFFLSCVFSLIIYLVQQSTGVMKNIPLVYRVENAVAAYIVYIGKMFWPSRLAVFYPYYVGRMPSWQIASAALLFVLITVLTLRQARQRPYLTVGWLWYVITLIPVVGLVQVGLQAAADRYTYVPLIGLFILVTWGIDGLFVWRRYQQPVLASSAVILLSVLGITSWHQLGYWRNSTTLYRHAIESVPDNWWAYDNLGAEFLKQGKVDEAVMYFTESLRIRPDYARAHVNLSAALLSQNKFNEAIEHCNTAIQIGLDGAETHINLARALQSQGKFYEAVTHYRQALRYTPDDADIHIGLGRAFQSLGRLDDAVKHYNLALQLRPDDVDGRNNLGVALAMQGKTDAAAAQFLYSLRIKPNCAEAHGNLGALLSGQGKLEEAISHYRQALQLKPDYADAHNNLGIALKSQGKFDEAMVHFREALRIKPNWPLPLSEMASILIVHPDPNKRNVAGAVELAEQAAELTKYKDASVLDTLAAAYAAVGQFDKAVSTAQSALTLADKNAELADCLRKKIENYKLGKP